MFSFWNKRMRKIEFKNKESLLSEDDNVFGWADAGLWLWDNRAAVSLIDDESIVFCRLKLLLLHCRRSQSVIFFVKYLQLCKCAMSGCFLWLLLKEK